MATRWLQPTRQAAVTALFPCRFLRRDHLQHPSGDPFWPLGSTPAGFLTLPTYPAALYYTSKVTNSRRWRLFDAASAPQPRVNAVGRDFPLPLCPVRPGRL